jgi:hypothetical protein
MEVSGKVKRLGTHVKSSSETLTQEMIRVKHMMRNPEHQNMKGALSFTMKHKGAPTKVK